jgi:hypothetical protein
MKIQMIKYKYKLPFNMYKPISFRWNEIINTGNIITIYIIIEEPNNQTGFRGKYYYSITKVQEKYFLIRHLARKLYRNDNKLRVEREFDSYDRVKFCMDERIAGWQDHPDRTYLVDTINVMEK